jgi:hypothetical protein
MKPYAHQTRKGAKGESICPCCASRPTKKEPKHRARQEAKREIRKASDNKEE